MTISTAEQVDFLWKKVLYGVTDTSFGKAGSNETIASPTTAYSTYVWTQSNSIPVPAPASNSSVVVCYTGANRLHLSNDTTSPVNQTWLTGQINFIPPTFDATYAVKVYLGDPQTTGVQAYPTSSGYEWVFDYAAGVLNFINTIPAGVSNGVYVVGFQYQGTTLDQTLSTIANSVTDSSKISVVSNIAARNALTPHAGDVAHVLDADGDPTNPVPGGWADYLWNGSAWTRTATQASQASDAMTSSITMNAASFATANSVVGTVGGGTRVVEVSVVVTTPFDAGADVTIGDDANTSLLLDGTEVDLSTAGNYVVQPVYQFPMDVDTNVEVYYTGSPTVGNATVTITWA